MKTRLTVGVGCAVALAASVALAGGYDVLVDTEARAVATNAQDSASAAATVATNAQTYASGVQTVATNAQLSANDAATVATNAQSYASAVQTVATNAQLAATDAATVATNAQDSASSAATVATNAQLSANDAATVATNAQSYASGVQTVATNAQLSANTATTIGTNAQLTATDAAVVATNAQTYATDTRGIATNAQTYASGVQITATNAQLSANDAATVATNAQLSANDAATVATNAQSYASENREQITVVSNLVGTASEDAVLFRVSISTNWYFLENVVTPVEWNTENSDFGSCFANSVFTAPTNGIYSFQWAATWIRSGTVNFLDCKIIANGTNLCSTLVPGYADVFGNFQLNVENYFLNKGSTVTSTIAGAADSTNYLAGATRSVVFTGRLVKQAATNQW